MGEIVDVAHVVGAESVGRVVGDVLLASGVLPREMPLAVALRDGLGSPAAAVLDGCEGADAALIARLTSGVPVWSVGPARAAVLAVEDHGGGLLVRSLGPPTFPALAEAWGLVHAAARRRHDRRRAETRDQILAGIDRAPLLVAVTDAGGGVRHLSGGARQILGDLPIGSSLLASLPGAGPALAEQLGAALLRVGRWEGSVRVSGPEGPVPLRLVVDAIPGSDGVPVGWFVTGTRASAPVVTSGDTPAWGDWVSHEINNALALVVRSLEEVRGGVTDPAVARAIELALGGAAQVRGFARALGQGGESLSEQVSLGRLVPTILALAEPETRGRARVSCTIGDVPPVLGSEAWLGQVLLNLLLNAAQALDPREGSRNEVAVVCRRSGEHGVVLEVHDNGRGIPAEDRERVFEPYFHRRVGGRGLGLYVVRQAVERMGGQIEVQSTVGRGTTFRVHLQAAPTALPEGWRARLLLVDDEPLLVRGLRRLLEHEFDVVVADSVSAALLLTQSETFDLILCDYAMADGTGADVHAALLERDPALARRLLLLTGGATTRSAAAFLASFPRRVLDKATSPLEIRRVIRETLGELGPHPTPASGTTLSEC